MWQYWRYAVAEQHAWSGQQKKGVRSLMCRCCRRRVVGGLVQSTGAYSPVEGMESRWEDANCLNRRCHLICCWLLLVATSPQSDFWCSNDLWALRSVGCLAPPSRCLRDLFLLVLSRDAVVFSQCFEVASSAVGWELSPLPLTLFV